MILKNKSKINFLQIIQNNIQKNKKQTFKLPYFSILMHKKLNYFKYITNKIYIYSSGQLMGNKIKRFKFFKKSTNSHGYTISILNKKLIDNFKSINIFYCKNFNYKNYIWIKKFYFLYKPKINFFLMSSSWNYITKNKKRIKRRVYKKLLKNDSNV